ncbi:hypothetical protein GCM10008018_42310 [Paenibacillus marchantiophytorum]|uniref:Uncharacterized protein n=1 Tax=Paenibacillus marchantiophytorum TaxID=1619310 RepID=A0ABQ1EYD3_9BACL|nr:hypothetical protein [Paenibacillus marchantiophytorum]GFZ91574.1 hypothetical protein GCM10008018_42310 [Paenibacillus marchantiophytorum]
MKKKLIVSMLAVLLSCGSVAYGASEDTHSTQGSISLKEWNSFQINVLDATKLNNPIVLDDWATALKMATALPEKDSEAWINTYVHGLGQGTEITRENAVGGMGAGQGKN